MHVRMPLCVHRVRYGDMVVGTKIATSQYAFKCRLKITPVRCGWEQPQSRWPVCDTYMHEGQHAVWCMIKYLFILMISFNAIKRNIFWFEPHIGYLLRGNPLLTSNQSVLMQRHPVSQPAWTESSALQCLTHGMCHRRRRGAVASKLIVASRNRGDVVAASAKKVWRGRPLVLSICINHEELWNERSNEKTETRLRPGLLQILSRNIHLGIVIYCLMTINCAFER